MKNLFNHHKTHHWLVVLLLLSFFGVSNAKATEPVTQKETIMISVGAVFVAGYYLWKEYMKYSDRREKAERARESAVAKSKHREMSAKRRDELHANLVNEHNRKSRAGKYPTKFDETAEQKRLAWLKDQHLDIYKLSRDAQLSKMGEQNAEFENWYKREITYRQHVAEHKRRIKSNEYPTRFEQELEEKRLAWLADKALWIQVRKRDIHLESMREDRKFLAWETGERSKAFQRLRKTHPLLRYIDGLSDKDRTFNAAGKKYMGSNYVSLNFPDLDPVKLTYEDDGKMRSLFFKTKARIDSTERSVMATYICFSLYDNFKEEQRPEMVIINAAPGGANCNTAVVGAVLSGGMR